MIDMHTHSTYSDGTCSPLELIHLAKEANLTAIALTDHDTINGIKEAKEAAKQYNLELISGIEFATMYEEFNREIHIIGLFIDENSKYLNEKLEFIKNSRLKRNLKMIEKLQNLGFDITYDELKEISKSEIITRAHYAKILELKKYVKNKKEAFQKYISPSKPAYVEREFLTPKICIETILKSGGIAVLAHPTLYNLNYLQIELMCKKLIEYGLKGIEGYYSTYTKNQEKEILKIAKNLNLLISGGSDFHGDNKPDIKIGVGRGNLNIPYTLLEDMKKTLTF